MRKVISFNMSTLDGFFAGPKGEIDWHNVDGEFNEFAIQQLNTVGGLIFGRITYQLMASYWPTPETVRDDRLVAEKMNDLPKYVFSHTLERADWNHTTLIKGDASKELARLKQASGGDLYIFGSADLTRTFIQAGLVDEFRVMVAPVLLGRGKPLFPGLQGRLDLSLEKARTFRSGNMLLYYHPKNAEAPLTDLRSRERKGAEG